VPIRDGNTAIPFTGQLKPNYIGSNITIGFRPQQIRISRAQKDSASIPGSVKITEFQGETTVLTVTLGDIRSTEIKAVVAADEKFETGNTVWLNLAPEIIHLFDGDLPVVHRRAVN
jgi:ABC-type sugar transport system ATPase subunit